MWVLLCPDLCLVQHLFLLEKLVEEKKKEKEYTDLEGEKKNLPIHCPKSSISTKPGKDKKGVFPLFAEHGK